MKHIPWSDMVSTMCGVKVSEGAELIEEGVTYPQEEVCSDCRFAYNVLEAGFYEEGPTMFGAVKVRGQA